MPILFNGIECRTPWLYEFVPYGGENILARNDANV